MNLTQCRHPSMKIRPYGSNDDMLDPQAEAAVCSSCGAVLFELRGRERQETERSPLADRVDDLRAWARSRISVCREQERKFADAWPESNGKGPPQALVEAWTERRALQAVLEQLDLEAAAPHQGGDKP